jgi:hypothetical protein
VTSCPQVYVQARIRFADGSTSLGCAAEMMIPKWFDKNPALSNEDNFQQLRDALWPPAPPTARTQARTAWQHFAQHYQALLESGAAAGLNPLAASYGPALLDRAILDALLLKLNCSFAAGMSANVAGMDVRGSGLAGDLRISTWRASCRCRCRASRSRRGTPSAWPMRSTQADQPGRRAHRRPAHLAGGVPSPATATGISRSSSAATPKPTWRA